MTTKKENLKKEKSKKIKFGTTIDPILLRLINKKCRENDETVTLQLHKAFKLLYPEYKR